MYRNIKKIYSTEVQNNIMPTIIMVLFLINKYRRLGLQGTNYFVKLTGIPFTVCMYTVILKCKLTGPRSLDYIVGAGI